MPVKQLIIFATAFTLFQLGFEYLRGTQMNGSIFTGILATTIVATAAYAVFTRWMQRRNNRRD